MSTTTPGPVAVDSPPGEHRCSRCNKRCGRSRDLCQGCFYTVIRDDLAPCIGVKITHGPLPSSGRMRVLSSAPLDVLSFMHLNGAE